MARDTRNDGHLDLALERTIEAPRSLIWKVWTDPDHVKEWWAPAPWTTSRCEIDLRPGGIFRTVLRSPEGQEFPHLGCFIELIENEKLVITNALEPGYRPARGPAGKDQESTDCADIPFTSILTLKERGGKTHYSIVVLHRDEVDRRRHEEMGFYDGWNTCLDQLIEAVGRLRGSTPAAGRSLR
jgi:uncharacterized protein YndB with AHSA1/START domain